MHNMPYRNEKRCFKVIISSGFSLLSYYFHLIGIVPSTRFNCTKLFDEQKCLTSFFTLWPEIVTRNMIFIESNQWKNCVSVSEWRMDYTLYQFVFEWNRQPWLFTGINCTPYMIKNFRFTYIQYCIYLRLYNIREGSRQPYSKDLVIT